MKPTALGYYLCIYPEGDGKKHLLLGFNARGFFKYSQICESKADAIKKRRAFRLYHARLAKAKRPPMRTR